MGPCMCGALDCRSCGPAQGHDAQWEGVYWRAQYDVMRTPLHIAEALDDLLQRPDKPIKEFALERTADELLVLVLTEPDRQALDALRKLREIIAAAVEPVAQREAERRMEAARKVLA